MKTKNNFRNAMIILLILTILIVKPHLPWHQY